MKNILIISMMFFAVEKVFPSSLSSLFTPGRFIDPCLNFLCLVLKLYQTHDRIKQLYHKPSHIPQLYNKYDQSYWKINLLVYVQQVQIVIQRTFPSYSEYWLNCHSISSLIYLLSYVYSLDVSVFHEPYKALLVSIVFVCYI